MRRIKLEAAKSRRINIRIDDRVIILVAIKVNERPRIIRRGVS
jgi:hypothetical protein